MGRQQLYVHGYGSTESTRLQDQASSLAELLHSDTSYADGSWVLEVGCGVGAQTVTLAENSPAANIISMDISRSSLRQAKAVADEAGITNVRFQQGDLFDLPFGSESFDHLFICFVLEHLEDPRKALTELGTLLKPGGTVTVIEGDHGSTYFYPDSEAARKVVQCQVELQQRAGGNANIGRELYPLLRSAGFGPVRVSPRMVYVDSSKPGLVEGFTQNTFTAMIEGIREASIAHGLVDEMAFDEGIRGLHRAAQEDGVFCYTFFKGTSTNAGQESAAQRHDKRSHD
jgi:SAM-dependent methyltransferase